MKIVRQLLERSLPAALALVFVGGNAFAAEPPAKPEARTQAMPANKPEAKPETKVDAETQAQVDELNAKLKKILDATEPVKCYRLLPDGQITVGQAVELCGGTTNAVKTVQCFEEAWGTPIEGGLGLNLGQAVRLCKTAQAIQRE